MPNPLAFVEWLWIDSFCDDWAQTPSEEYGLRELLREQGAKGRVRTRGVDDYPEEVHREDVIKLMCEHGFPLRILDPQWEGDLHPIEDPKHADYIAEAHAVFAVWRDLRPQTLKAYPKSQKQQILGFLAERFPHLNKNQHERIAVLMNPGKSGGVPSSKK